MTEVHVTVVCRGANAPADAIRLVNVALQAATSTEVRIEKKETPE